MPPLIFILAYSKTKRLQFSISRQK